jgi:glutamate N-acetyltransferase/amino-acid N-acetyltransferase
MNIIKKEINSMDHGSGVTYAKGFLADGVACGIKKNGHKDLALVCCETPAKAAGIFTRNVVKGHSLQLAQRNVADGKAQAVIINAGNANACLAKRGARDALRMADLTANAVGCAPQDVLTASTGVIGMPLPMEKIEYGLTQMNPRKDGGIAAAEAIMTTDTIAKQAECCISIDGAEIRIGGMAKGSGMIHPNMATMISVITTDANISSGALNAALKAAADVSYNRISIDGDTSVCDKVLLMASCMAGNDEITVGAPAYDVFVDALKDVCIRLAKMLASDGEGATKLLTIDIRGARSNDDAHKIAGAIARSPLCKTAAFGNDANWGRLLTAAGYSGADFDPEKVDIYIGDIQVCAAGGALAFDEDAALHVLTQKEVVYTLIFGDGNGADMMWTCDFSVDYVKINADYRT